MWRVDVLPTPNTATWWHLRIVSVGCSKECTSLAVFTHLNRWRAVTHTFLTVWCVCLNKMHGPCVLCTFYLTTLTDHLRHQVIISCDHVWSVWTSYIYILIRRSWLKEKLMMLAVNQWSWPQLLAKYRIALSLLCPWWKVGGSHRSSSCEGSNNLLYRHLQNPTAGSL